jgi:hypothetical protein
MKAKQLILLFFLCLTSLPLAAQTDDREVLFSVNEGTLIGIGNHNIKNTYLSDIKYTGLGVQLMNERMRSTSLFNRRLSSQQILYADLASTYNPAKTIGALSGVAEYSYGYHYRFQSAQPFKLLTGVSLHGLMGFLYNTQSSNNPVALSADIDLNFSVAAIYSFHLRQHPLAIRYQADMSFIGVAFAPNYEQSYYEIFGLGNHYGIVHLTSLHNKFAMRNFLTFDFPLGNFTVRVGYLNKLYYTDINGIDTHHVSHNMMIGFAKEFVSFGGKRLKNKHSYQSAFY